MRLSLVVLFCFFLTRLVAQQHHSTVIDIADIRHFDSVEKKCFLFLAPRNSISPAKIPYLPFPSATTSRSFVADSLMERDCFLKFSLTNSGDTAKEVYFLPGYFLSSLSMYTAPIGDTVNLKKLESRKDSSRLFEGCYLIRMEPHDTAIFYAQFNFVRSTFNLYSPRIIEKDYLWTWVMMNKSRDSLLNVITYVACGMLLLMIFYSLAVYLQNNRKEFFYYAVYASCMVILLFLKSFLFFKPSPFNAFYEEYLDFPLLCAGVFFYLVFVRVFLNARENHPSLYKVLRISEKGLIILVCIFSMIYFFTDKYIILNILENNIIKLAMFAIGIYFIVYSIKRKDPLLNFLAAGNIALVLFSMISLSIIIFKWRVMPDNPTFIFNRSMLYYEAGLVLELIFFLSGLAYKNKKDIIEQVKERERFKLENERKEFEKQMAVLEVRQEERDRISADMHDDLGSRVTAIRLMSEIVKSKMNTEQFPEIDKISHSANELLGSMNTIIWTMKSSNDTLESLVAYLRAYAIEYFDGTPVSCTVEVSPLVEMEVNGEKRRNLFLCFKETLNNILKHAHATTTHIQIDAGNEKLLIRVKDNGAGINVKNLRRFGNGLSNMKKRMQSIQGQFMIENDNGTVVVFEMPL